MAGGTNAATEPTPAESSRDQEKAQAGDENGPNQLPTEQVTQHDNDNRPLPALPPRPLPPAHHETLRQRQQPLPPPHGVHFGPLPIEDTEGLSNYVRPYYPRWHRTQLGLLVLSLLVSAVIFGVSLALGFHVAPYYSVDYGLPVDYEFGTSGTAAGLAVLISSIELLTTCLSRRRQGMHPGALVAFHLIIWLMALVAVVVVTIYGTDTFYSDWYSYPKADLMLLHSQSQVYEQVLLGFVCVLLVIHFVLFVGACVETNRVELAKRKVVVVRVPVQAGAPFHGGHYSAYGPPPGFVLPPGAQPGQYQIPTMAPVPPQRGEGPAPPQQATLYGGYYAPAPQGMAWTGQQQGNPPLLQGYYAPAPVPERTASKQRRSQRRSQRQSQVQPTSQPAEQQTTRDEQVRPEEVVTEKST